MKVTLTTLGHSRWVLIQSGRRLGLLSIKTTKENVTIFGIILKKKKLAHPKVQYPGNQSSEVENKVCSQGQKDYYLYYTKSFK